MQDSRASHNSPADQSAEPVQLDLFDTTSSSKKTDPVRDEDPAPEAQQALTPKQKPKVQKGARPKETGDTKPFQAYLSVKQVAERYKLSVTTIWRQARNPDTPFPAPYKLLSGTTRWALADLTAYEEDVAGGQERK